MVKIGCTINLTFFFQSSPILLFPFPLSCCAYFFSFILSSFFLSSTYCLSSVYAPYFPLSSISCSSLDSHNMFGIFLLFFFLFFSSSYFLLLLRSVCCGRWERRIGKWCFLLFSLPPLSYITLYKTKKIHIMGGVELADHINFLFGLFPFFFSFSFSFSSSFFFRT